MEDNTKSAKRIITKTIHAKDYEVDAKYRNRNIIAYITDTQMSLRADSMLAMNQLVALL